MGLGVLFGGGEERRGASNRDQCREGGLVVTGGQRVGCRKGRVKVLLELEQ